MNTSKLIFTYLIFLFGATVHASQLTPEQSAAKSYGLILYNQFKDGEPDLRIAATAGDRESQFYLAKDLQNTARYMTAEAQKWYAAAAEQGDMYSMYQLSHNRSDLCHAMGNCPKGTRTAGEWAKTLINTAKPLAEQGDGEAMYMMYLVTGNLEWLKNRRVPDSLSNNIGWQSDTKTGKVLFFHPGSAPSGSRSCTKNLRREDIRLPCMDMRKGLELARI